MGYWVYILESKTHNRLYIGSSSNPEIRLKYHNLGKENWSSKYLPWELISKTRFPSKTVALKIEKKLKSYKNKGYIKYLISINGIKIDIIK